MMPVSNVISTATFTHRTPESTDNDTLLINEWQVWAKQARPGRGENREIVVERLKVCLGYHTTRLNLSGLGLTELPMQLPAFLEELYISNNYLTRLPETLPVSLKALDASNNLLTHLPGRLPVSLTELYVADNRLSNLPETLPTSLEILCVNGNRLRRLPDNLPAFLQELNVGNNCLTSLPLTLPSALEVLNVNYNCLTSLPARLPVFLSTLYINHNQLHHLPDNFPDSIDTLEISHNQLASLPENLPALFELHVHDNQLTSLPANLPRSLERLDASHNQLTQLPEHLPMLLIFLDVSHNRLTRLPVTLPNSLETLNVGHNHRPLLPEHLPHSLIATDIGGLMTGSQCETLSGFLTEIRCWNSDTKPWEAIYSEANACTFAEFLNKLNKGKNCQSRNLFSQVSHWLAYLADESCRELRAQTFALAGEAAESCVDRASFYFNHMHILMVEHQLLDSNAPLTQVVETIRGAFRLQVLERLATAKVAERQRESPGFAEDLEVYLAYQYKLRQPLSLPVYTELQFERFAAITDEDICQAEKTVLEIEKTDFVRHWLTESALWTAKLEQWNMEKKAAADNQYLDAITASDFNEAVNKALNEKGISVNDADAHRGMSQTLAADLFYQQRYQLTQEYLAEYGALSLLYRFSLTPLSQC